MNAGNRQEEKERKPRHQDGSWWRRIINKAISSGAEKQIALTSMELFWLQRRQWKPQKNKAFQTPPQSTLWRSNKESDKCVRDVSIGINKASPCPCSSCRLKEITKAVAHYLMKDLASINTGQSNGFRKMKNTKQVLHSAQFVVFFFSNIAFPDLYTQCQIKVETELKAIHYYADTTDLWSSRNMEPYISVTVHYDF